MWIVKHWFKNGKIYKLKLDESRGQQYKIEGNWLVVQSYPTRVRTAFYKKDEWAGTREQALQMVAYQTQKRIHTAEKLIHKLHTMTVEVIE